jgi:hypothetical protein
VHARKESDEGEGRRGLGASCREVGHGDQAFGNGKPGEARDAMAAQLAHEAVAMGFGGAGADVEAACNVLITQAFGDAGEDFVLATCEAGNRQPVDGGEWSVENGGAAGAIAGNRIRQLTGARTGTSPGSRASRIVATWIAHEYEMLLADGARRTGFEKRRLRRHPRRRQIESTLL